MDAGSCPFVFCYDEQTHTWTNTGSVLVGHRSADRPGHEARSLPSWSTRVQIREVESEVSFIDRAALEVEDEDGRVHWLPAVNPRLRSQDHRYAVLRQNEREELRFSGENRGWRRRILHLWGYYVPLQSPSAARAGEKAPATDRRAAFPLPPAGALLNRGHGSY
jgi:hypothetical protein